MEHVCGHWNVETAMAMANSGLCYWVFVVLLRSFVWLLLLMPPCVLSFWFCFVLVNESAHWTLSFGCCWAWLSVDVMVVFCVTYEDALVRLDQLTCRTLCVNSWDEAWCVDDRWMTWSQYWLHQRDCLVVQPIHQRWCDKHALSPRFVLFCFLLCLRYTFPLLIYFPTLASLI